MQPPKGGKGVKGQSCQCEEDQAHWANTGEQCWRYKMLQGKATVIPSPEAYASVANPSLRV